MVLNKEQILAGKQHTETIKIESLNDEVELRVLSQAEMGEIERIEARALGTFETQETANRNGKRQEKGKVSSTAKINLVKQTEASNSAKAKAVALSLSVNDTWAISEVEALPRKVFDEIYEAVQEINGISKDTESEIDQFPED